MKLTAENVTIGAALVGVALWTAALASDVNTNSIHTLKANIERWTEMKLIYETKFPEPRALAVQTIILNLERDISLSESEIASRQNKKGED